MEKTSPKKLFSRKRREAVKARARRINKHDAGFMEKIAAETMYERLAVVNREFEHALDLFSQFDEMSKRLEAAENVKKVARFTGTDLAHRSNAEDEAIAQLWDENQPLPFYPESLNLITSVFGLHWTNDLPGILYQARTLLKPDGLFLAAMPGDQTLKELRECLIAAETEETGGVSLRIEPFGEVRQYGNLLQRAGLALPVVDSEQYTIRYKSLRALIDDLRAMGATSTLEQRSAFASRNLFQRCEEIYFERFSDADGKIRATAELVFLSGWKPHESQQKPLKPGSAKASLSDFL